MTTIDAVTDVRSSTLPGSTPPLDSYDHVSSGWSETEYRADLGNPAVEGGYWCGGEGSVSFDSWPYTELCVILSGRVAVEDSEGRRREWGAGQSFLIPQGFSGTWLTLEPTEKVFVGVHS
ncbi:cupin domain-containing protein [Leucobacter sp. USCH14]|uniref:cupin domain-containing protein n=1 Tax=Leucobacter sp. USCH14 TaxID=3024838 RepID=UPI0030B6709C